VKNLWLSRRKFIGGLLALPAFTIADSFALEPTWLRIKKIQLPNSIGKRFVHFTDVHFKGDRDYLLKVVQTINAQAPDFVCFTGDLVEDAQFLPEALQILSGIQAPMYGIPGNHDFWAEIDFDLPIEVFSRSGGKWLMDEDISICGDSIRLIGITGTKPSAFVGMSGARNILLSHYPNGIDSFKHTRFDLTISGHSHGGQIRLPFLGALIVPFGVGEYDMGLFQTVAGPLYVNPGIGYFYLNIRFCCRPEITVFSI
jgi:predicted MPP superfamily phosphohydrolase